MELSYGMPGKDQSDLYYVSCYTCKNKPDWEDADRLIARNRALEQVMGRLQAHPDSTAITSTSISKKRGSTVAFLEHPPPPPPASQFTSKQATSGKRSKLLSILDPDKGKRAPPFAIEINDGGEGEGDISASTNNANLDVPRADSPLPDSDPEDEDNVLRQLYTASQALAAIPYTEQGIHDALADGRDEEQLDSMQEDEEQVLDQMDYIDKRTGMPPASQFKRATVRT